METFTKLRAFVDNPDYSRQRNDTIQALKLEEIDAPIVEIVRSLTKLSHCFPLQSCYGHFLYEGQDDPFNTAPLPDTNSISRVDYKIAYLALCIEPNHRGFALFNGLKDLPRLDPEYIQFGCAEWFWERQVNSFALQVEPERHKTKDRVGVDYGEALRIENARNRFFAGLESLINTHLDTTESG